MRYRARVGSLEIASTQVYRDSPEIELMPVSRANLAIALMLACQASRETESTPAYLDNLEIVLMPVFPVNLEIEWMRAYQANPEIESMLACPDSPETVWMLEDRGSRISVDRDDLAIIYRIFQAKLLTEANGRIGGKRTWATFVIIGKTTGAITEIGTAIVGGMIITSIIRTIQDSVSGPEPRGRGYPTGATTAGPSPSTTTTERMFITTMAQCTTEISQYAQSSSTSIRPRQSL